MGSSVGQARTVIFWRSYNGDLRALLKGENIQCVPDAAWSWLAWHKDRRRSYYWLCSTRLSLDMWPLYQLGLVAADNRTRTNHRYKFRAIGASSTGLRYSFAARTVSDGNQLIDVVEQETAFKAQLARCARGLWHASCDRRTVRLSHDACHNPLPSLAWYSTRRSADYCARTRTCA